MKRLFLAVTTLLIAILPALGIAQSSYFSIGELLEQTPDRWQNEYQTVRNETVKVDCKIVLPDADAFPVIKVIASPKRSEAGEAEWTEGLIYWSALEEYVCPHKKRLAFVNDPGEFVCSKDAFCEYMLPYYESDKYAWETSLLFPDALDFSVVYPENSSVTLGEAIEYYQKKIDTIFEGESIVVRLSPTHLSSYDGVIYSTKDHKKITPCGQYNLNFEQIFHNVPILGIINEAFNEGLRNEKVEGNLYHGGGRGDMTLAVPDEDFFARMRFYQEQEVVEQDVPLVSFETARALWQKEIEAGRLRDVRHVELGYYAYRDATDRDVFWLMPVWTCFGTYLTQADDEPLTVADGLSAADAYMEYAKMLVVSGQHGELLDRCNKSNDRSVHPKLLIWDKVK